MCSSNIVLFDLSSSTAVACVVSFDKAWSYNPGTASALSFKPKAFLRIVFLL